MTHTITHSASKAGVINLANTSAQILGGTGIRVVRPLFRSLRSAPERFLLSGNAFRPRFLTGDLVRTERDLPGLDRDWHDDLYL